MAALALLSFFSGLAVLVGFFGGMALPLGILDIWFAVVVGGHGSRSCRSG